MKLPALLLLILLTGGSLVLTQTASDQVPPPTDSTTPSSDVVPPTDNTVAPTDNTVVPPADNTVTPTDNTVVPSDNATVPAAANETIPAANETVVPAGNETVVPAGNETVVPAGNETVPSNESTAGNETVPGNETAGGANETGGGAAGGAGEVSNETAGAESLTLNSDDAVLVFINFQNGWISDQASPAQNQLENFWKNVQALDGVGQAFGLPTFMVTGDNQTYGAWWSQLSNNTNATIIQAANESDFAFQNQEFLSALEATGRRNVIIAALTADAELVQNSILAKDLGYNVWPVVDSSPYYEQGDLGITLQNLGLAGIAGKTWLGVSKYLLNSHPEMLSAVNQVYRDYLSGVTINDNSATPATNGGQGGRRFL